MRLSIVGVHAWHECSCWTNHCCRPVDCSSKKALPLEPGFVNKVIYKDQVGSGWGVGGSAVWTLQTPNQGLFGSNASCFDLDDDVSDHVKTISQRLLPALPCPALPCPALMSACAAHAPWISRHTAYLNMAAVSRDRHHSAFLARLSHNF